MSIAQVKDDFSIIRKNLVTLIRNVRLVNSLFRGEFDGSNQSNNGQSRIRTYTSDLVMTYPGQNLEDQLYAQLLLCIFSPLSISGILPRRFGANKCTKHYAILGI